MKNKVSDFALSMDRKSVGEVPPATTERPKVEYPSEREMIIREDGTLTFPSDEILFKGRYISKHRIQEAIDEVIPLDEKCATNMILNNALKKELRLDK